MSIRCLPEIINKLSLFGRIDFNSHYVLVRGFTSLRSRKKETMHHYSRLTRGVARPGFAVTHALLEPVDGDVVGTQPVGGILNPDEADCLLDGDRGRDTVFYFGKSLIVCVTGHKTDRK